MTRQQINSYRDLHVWQKGMMLAEQCRRLTKVYPKVEIYGITSRIRRTAMSIPANIAEGYGRENQDEYIQFLRIARNSLKELESHLMIAERAKIASSDSIQSLLALCKTEEEMLGALIRSLQRKGQGTTNH